MWGLQCAELSVGGISVAEIARNCFEGRATSVCAKRRGFGFGYRSEKLFVGDIKFLVCAAPARCHTCKRMGPPCVIRGALVRLKFSAHTNSLGVIANGSGVSSKSRVLKGAFSDEEALRTRALARDRLKVRLASHEGNFVRASKETIRDDLGVSHSCWAVTEEVGMRSALLGRENSVVGKSRKVVYSAASAAPQPRLTGIGYSDASLKSRETDEQEVETQESADGDVNYGENDDVAERKKKAFMEWSVKKLREKGRSVLPVLEDMRQVFAPNTPPVEVISRNLLWNASDDTRSSSSSPRQENFSSSSRSPISTESLPSTPVSKKAWTQTLDARRYSVAGNHAEERESAALERLVEPASRTALSRKGDVEKSSMKRATANVVDGNSTLTSSVQLPAKLPSKTDVQGPKPFLIKRSTQLPDNWDGPSGTVVLIDKPEGWTSFAVCGRLRGALKIQKVGHAGTLDPMATGLLIVCIGKATKLADSYQAMTKVYSGTFRLGELTPSLDADTEVTDVLPWEHIKDEDIQNAKLAFIGDIMQSPPMFSAIKVKGERLYKKARRGEEVVVPARLVNVEDFQLERSSENRQDIHFRVVCSKGTYVRSLCADLAWSLDSFAHLTALRREKIGRYRASDAWPIEELLEKYSDQLNNVTFRV